MKPNRVWSAAITMLVVAVTTSGQTTRPGANRDKDPRYALAWERASVVVQFRNYAIRSDLDADVTRALGVHLDRISGEYTRVLSGLQQRRTNNRLQVFLFRTYESYLSTLALRFDADAEGTGGMTIRDGTKITMAAWQGERGVIELEAVLRHEGFHQYSEI